MKKPKLPIKPYPPYKPSKPSKYIKQNTNLGNITINEYSAYSFNEIEALVKTNIGDIDISDVDIEFEIVIEPSYYDDTIKTIVMRLSTKSEIENPNYSILYDNYLKDGKTYNVAYKDYRLRLKEYKKELDLYYLKLDKYNLFRLKERAKKLEQKLKV